MKINQWTLGLAAAGVVSLASAVQAEEAANQVMTAVSATTLSGYVDTSIMWRPGTASRTGTATRAGAGAFTGAGKQDGFNLNVVKLRLEKVLDESEWAAGYRAELLFGPDATAYNTTLGPVVLGQGDFSIKDAYVALRAPIGNGLDFKLGSFSTISGYEVFEAGDNANYSRSYAWQVEPTQHTGLLTSYKVSDSVTVKAGAANTYGTGINARTARGVTATGGRNEARKTYMAGLFLTAPESFGAFKGATLTGTAHKGFNNRANGAPVAVTSDTVSYYVGLTTPTGLEGLSVGASYDYTGTTANSVTKLGSTYFNATSLYTSYQATEKLKLNFRGEYASGTRGIIANMTTSVVGGGGIAPFSGAGAVPSHDQVMAATLTADYALWANVISRVELRWDHDLSQAKDGSLFDTRAGLGAKNMMTVALNVIYKF